MLLDSAGVLALAAPAVTDEPHAPEVQVPDADLIATCEMVRRLDEQSPALYHGPNVIEAAMEQLDRRTLALPRGSVVQHDARERADAVCVSLGRVTEAATECPARSDDEAIAKASLLRRLCATSGDDASLGERLAISLYDDLIGGAS